MKLKVAQTWLDFSDIGKVELPALNDQEKAAVAFCKNWKAGKQVFEFDTSGSTGVPRKIRFKRAQLQSSAELTRVALELTPGTRALVCLDCTFIAGAMMLVRGMVIGMDLIIQPPTANPFLSLDETVDFVALVPYQLASALNQSPSKVSALKTVIVGGAPLPQELNVKIQDLPGRYFATYGMTETISHIALQKLNGTNRQDFFELLPGVSATIDQRGCLVIHASHLGDTPIVTNDVVTMITPTRFKWQGRVDDVINTGGVKVHPAMIEQAAGKVLNNLQIDRRYFVTGLPDNELGTRVVLVIEGLPLSQEIDFLKALSSTLSKYELPRQLLYLEQFVETPTQKVDRIKTLEAIKRA